MPDNILVVDDEREIADLVELYLQNENYAVFKFYSAREALACVESTELDLAILDESEERQDPATMRRAVMDVMSINAFTYATAMTSFDAEVYHDAMEGLGMLTALPCPARTADGERLWAELANFVSTDIDHKA